MAKKKVSFSTSTHFRRVDRSFLTSFTLAFITALLCIVVFPVLGKANAVKSGVSSSQIAPNQKPDWIQQGKALYDAGQFAEAAKVLRQAALVAEGQKDSLKQAIALSDLSLVYGV